MEWLFGTICTIYFIDVVWNIGKDAHVNIYLEIYALEKIKVTQHFCTKHLS